MRESFKFKRVYYECINTLDIKAQGEVFRAIFKYVFENEIIHNLSLDANVVFTLLKEMIDEDFKKNKE